MRKSAGSVRYHIKLRMSNVSRKKAPMESLAKNLRTLKRKHKQCLRENKALAKSLAASKQELTEQCKALNREREIFSLHLPRIKSWMEDSVDALRKVTLNHINSVELLRHILDPDCSLSFTPLETSESEELPERKDLRPPGSHLQTHASVIYEEEEDEEQQQQHEKTVSQKTEIKKELHVHFERRALDNVTKRNARSEEKILCRRCSSPLTGPPDKGVSADSLDLQRTELQTPEESFLDVTQEVPTSSTPICPPKPSPRRRSGRRRGSIAPGTSTFRLSLGNRRRSERIQQTTPAEPRPSRSPQKSEVLGDQSLRPETPSDIEQPPAHEHPQDVAREDPQDTPRDSSLNSTEKRSKRRASKAVSYTEPTLKKKLRRP
ncbi:uncharacterized protein LOC135378901 isoform X2 [Ornithodoros turicata]|uniref:uncharacterized protein LOC135378901 isoform X2 n=1 Tax=Ornithodoros turicata TaxID=34597 RepID=UPI0031392E62